jgi:hypothetical protein
MEKTMHYVPRPEHTEQVRLALGLVRTQRLLITLDDWCRTLERAVGELDQRLQRLERGRAPQREGDS